MTRGIMAVLALAFTTLAATIIGVQPTAANDGPKPLKVLFLGDRGQTQGITAGSPVIDASGVLGQVTRVYPLSAEITLLTDKDAAIPVLNLRTQARAVAYGDPGSAAAGSGLELRFMAGNADVEAGDRLETSGVDGVYPPGLAGASVASVDKRGSSNFAKVALKPAARTEGLRHVLVVEPLTAQLPPRPVEPAASAPASSGTSRRKPGGGR